jgi:hypothetical protein
MEGLNAGNIASTRVPGVVFYGAIYQFVTPAKAGVQTSVGAAPRRDSLLETQCRGEAPLLPGFGFRRHDGDGGQLLSAQRKG